MLRKILITDVHTFEKLFHDASWLVDKVGISAAVVCYYVTRFLFHSILTRGFKRLVNLVAIDGLIENCAKWSWSIEYKLGLLRELVTIIYESVDNLSDNDEKVLEEFEDKFLKKIDPILRVELKATGMKEDKLIEINRSFNKNEGSKSIKKLDKYNHSLIGMLENYEEGIENDFTANREAIEGALPNLCKLYPDLDNWNILMKKWINGKIELATIDIQDVTSLDTQMMKVNNFVRGAFDADLWEIFASNKDHPNFKFLTKQIVKEFSNNDMRKFLDTTSELHYLHLFLCHNRILGPAHMFTVEKPHPHPEVLKRFDMNLVSAESGEIEVLMDVYRIHQTPLDASKTHKSSMDALDPTLVQEMKDINVYIKHAAEKIFNKFRKPKRIDPSQPIVNPNKPVILALDISSVPIDVSKSNLEWKYMIGLTNVYPDWNLISGILLLNTNSGISVEFVINQDAINPLSVVHIQLFQRINHECDRFNFDLDKLQ